ncbi:uncharacterized protein B0J16DRAFT_326174 [Fusarium flagelliforme]|uniref:uncharacterized protein n=1 Tax=Fusarium flagelliforme TaxID=2675880 RepID=UPI001E8E4F90|nr:uncharacterized protein B0J16DRAFT_326174 [Fusarium flagelliforme]KAH7196570.1 hypothetical protein B0J16DRAFT_326174 [Fusarium flagelliforme]
MSDLSAEVILTIIGTILGLLALLVSSLSAWFAYTSLHRRNSPPSDIETVGLVPVRLYPTFLIHGWPSSTAIPLPSMPTIPPISPPHSQPPHTNSPPNLVGESSSGVLRRLERVEHHQEI